MEGIQTIQALKAVQSSLPAQTTIPSDELVMLYAADGTPIAKIARDDLVKAVASVMASNSQTTFSKLLGVQANGTPMGIGASDLASVLGVISSSKIFQRKQGTNDFNTITNDGIYEITSMNNMANSPSTSSSYQHGFMIVGSWNMNLRPVQVVFVGYQELAIFMRAWASDSSWTSWKRVTLT